MAGEERLRLIAEFRDNASSGVRRLGRELGEIRTTPGMNSVQRWMRGFTVDAEKVQRNAAGVGSIMGSLGLGGVAAAGGVAAMAGAIKALADRTLDLQAVSRETGIAATQLKVLQNAASELRVDPEAITKGVQYLTSQLALARRGYGELYGLLNQVEPEFMRKIMAEDPAKAMDDVLARLARIPDDYVRAGHSLADGIQAQKQWTAALLGDQGLGRLVEQGPKALADAMADAARNTAPVTKGMVDSAKALDKSIHGFNEALDSLETKAGPTLFKHLEQGVQDFTAAFEQVEHAAEWLIKARDKPGEAVKDLAGAAVDAAKDKAGEIAGRWQDPHFDDKREGKGLFAPSAGDADKAARLAAMQTELDEVQAKIAADKNPVSFATREAGNMARVRELRDAMAALRDGSAEFVRPQPGARAPEGDRSGGLLHRSAYIEGEDDSPRRSAAGGMSPNMVMLWRELIASGVKAGFLAAVQEAQGGASTGGLGGGLSLASYGGGSLGGGGGGGGGAGSARYRAAGGGSFVGGPAPGANGHGLLNVPYTGSLDAKGAGGKLSPRELFAYLKSHGATDNEALMLTGAAGNESAFNPDAVHDIHGKNGPGHGLWGHNDKRLNMTGLSWQQQADRALDEVKRKYADKVNAARTPEELADAEADYERPQGFGVRNPRGAHNYTGRLNTLRRFGNEFGTMKNQIGGGRSVAGQVRGVLTIGGESYSYGSGGAGGSASIPFGDYPINPDSGNPWGRAHNAMDVNGTGQIWDKALGRMRTGIEMHAASTAEMVTHGCLGFLREQYPQLKQRVREMIAKTGHAYLHIGANGATITPNREADALDTKREQLAAKHTSTLSAAHRLLKWAERAANVEDPSDTPLTTFDMRDPKFAPPGWHKPGEQRPSLFDKGGMGGAQTVRHEGGAVVEIRGLPQGKGTRTETSGMISAVNLRRGGPVTQIA